MASQALVLIHLAVVPAWEAPDEPWHLAYAEVLASGRLPSADDTYEYHHPPGGYLWPALTLRALGWNAVPRAAYEPRFPLAANAYLHPMDDPGAAMLRLLRAVNGLLAAPACALAWAAARRLRRGGRGPSPILAAGLVILMPMTPFAAATVTNDTAAWLAGACLWYLAAVIASPAAARGGRRAGPRAERQAVARRGLALGAAASLAAGIKLNALPMVLVPVLAALIGPPGGTDSRARPRARWRGVGRAAAMLVVAVATAAFVLTLLAQLPLFAGLARLPAQLLQRSAGGSLADAGRLQDLLRLLDSTTGIYGWLNVTLDHRLRRLLLGALAACVGLSLLPTANQTAGPAAGAAIAAGGAPGRTRWLAAAGPLLLVLATLGNAAMDPAALQGRLLLPALPAAAWLVATGVARMPRVFAFALPGLLLLSQWVATTQLLPAAYGGPVNDAVLLQRGTDGAVVPSLLLKDGEAIDEVLTVTAPLRLQRLELGVIVGRGAGRLRLSLWRDPTGPGAAPVLLGRTEAPLAALGRRAIDGPTRIGPLADTSWLGVDLLPIPATFVPGTRLRARVELVPRAAGNGSEQNEAQLWSGEQPSARLLLVTPRPDDAPAIAWLAYGVQTTKAPR